MNQDLPKVIEDQLRRIAQLSPAEAQAYARVEFQTHDYHDVQPAATADADAFILRRCLHNNPDSECVRIIRAVAPALARPGTHLLINEKLIPPREPGAPRWKTKMILREDITMMISCGGKERTLKDFEKLLRDADSRLEVSMPRYTNLSLGCMDIRLTRW